MTAYVPQRESGKQYALRVIREKIVEMELQPGSWVSENELAKTLSLSRTPVREALQELCTVKLVDIFPQKGSRVSLINYDLVEEARFLRLALERAVVEQLCGGISEQGIQKLRENLKHQELYLSLGDHAAFFRMDNDFHYLLFTEARKETSFQLMSSMTAHFDRVRHMASQIVAAHRNLEDHIALLELIIGGDRAGADERIRRHLTHYQIDEKALREKYPDSYFL